MLVHALVAAIRTSPEPTVLAILNSLDKVLAHLIGRRLGVAVLGKNNTAQLLLIPINHIILLSFLFLLLLLQLSRISVQTLLLSLDTLTQVMRKLALPPLLTSALFEKLTQHSFRVHTKGHFLDLDGLEEFGGFLLCGFGGGLFLFACSLFGGFAFLVGGQVGGGSDLFDCALGGSSFFVLHAEGLVDGDLLGGIILLFGRHGGRVGCGDAGDERVKSARPVVGCLIFR